MGWRDQLQPASFRGVAFNVVSHSATFGRRSILHQFPFRDLPYVEDMGRRAREMRVDAIVLGDDYMTQRDALIEAIEQAGTGKLVHPYFGELTVSISDGGVEIEESTAQGGMCQIRFSCIESGEAKFPAATAATGDIVEARAQDALQATSSGFLRRFTALGLPGWAMNLATGRILGFIDNLRSALRLVTDPFSIRGSVYALLDALELSIAVDLGSSPASVVDQVQAIVAAVVDGFDPKSADVVLANLATVGAGEPHLPATTPTRIQDATNRDAILDMVRGSVAIGRCQASTALEFDDVASAEATRDSIVSQLDLVADATADDALFDALTVLRAAVVRDISARGASLAQIVEVTPTTTSPALVVAYELYQDASRDDDILARNQVVHPGFLPAGVPLEVPIGG